MPHLTENLKNFIKHESWTFAKTMPEWPHEYIVRGKVNEFLFIELVGYIRENGYQAAFYEKSLTYFCDDGFLYWTMGNPIEETTIINRCLEENSYEERFKKKLYPKMTDK